MSWLFAGAPNDASSSAVPFQTLLDKLTSPLLPSTETPSLPDCLDLADKIRGKEVSAKLAAQAFGKKLTGDNANVHLRTLHVLDYAIKNSGDAFIAEVGERAPLSSRGPAETVVDGLERIALNVKRNDLQEQLLSYIQNWALAISSMAKLDNHGKPKSSTPDMVLLYRELKNRGLQFPRPDTSSVAAMVESMSMPEWTDSDRCSYCRTGFTLLNRKHHCRNCGDIFCGNCSSKTLPLPHFGVTQPVRVCDKCYKSLKAGKVPTRRNSLPSSSSPTSEYAPSPQRSSTVSSKTGNRHSRSQSTRHVRFQEDEDLQRAIALSLAESEASQPSQPHQREGYRPGYPGKAREREPEPQTQAEALARFERAAKERNGTAAREPERRVLTAEEEADPDLKAAIEASLKEMESNRPSAPGASVNGRVHAGGERRTLEWPPASGQANANGSGYYDEYARSPEEEYYGGVRPTVPRLASYDLAATDSDALITFSQEVDAVRDSGRDPRNIRPYYDRAVPAEARLDHSKHHMENRQQSLKDMNSKLSHAVRLYNDKLEQHVAYKQHNQQPQYGQPQQAYQQPTQYGIYPAQPAPPQQVSQWHQPQQQAFSQPYSQPSYSAPAPAPVLSSPAPAPHQAYAQPPAPISSPPVSSIYPNLQALSISSPPPQQVQQPSYSQPPASLQAGQQAYFANQQPVHSPAAASSAPLPTTPLPVQPSQYRNYPAEQNHYIQPQPSGMSEAPQQANGSGHQPYQAYGQPSQPVPHQEAPSQPRQYAPLPAAQPSQPQERQYAPLPAAQPQPQPHQFGVPPQAQAESGQQQSGAYKHTMETLSQLPAAPNGALQQQRQWEREREPEAALIEL